MWARQTFRAMLPQLCVFGEMHPNRSVVSNRGAALRSSSLRARGAAAHLESAGRSADCQTLD
jgi:hypothetical protein